MNRKPILGLLVCYCVIVLVAGFLGSALSPMVAHADGSPIDPPAPEDTIHHSPSLGGPASAEALEVVDDSPSTTTPTTTIGYFKLFARSVLHWKWI